MMQISNNEFKELGFEPFLSEYLDETYKYFLNKETKVLLSVYKDNFIIETGCFIYPRATLRANGVSLTYLMPHLEFAYRRDSGRLLPQHSPCVSP